MRLLFALCLLVSLAARGNTSAPHSDYGWLPEYKKLFLRGGAEFLLSGSNYDNSGIAVNLPSNVDFSRNFFWLQPEYGIAQDWSLKMQLGILSSAVTTTAGAVSKSNSGLADFTSSVKWMVRPFDPIVTLEPYFVIPSAEAIVTSTKDVALGDGAFGAGFKIHTAHETNGFALGFSPGMLYRNKGYSLLITGDVYAQIDFKRGYFRGYSSVVFPIEITKLFDSSLTKHDVSGAAGSYALLSGSPFGVTAGGKLGLQLINELFLEAWFTKSFVGQRYPSFNQFGFSLFYAFDFLDNLPVKNIREIPFDSNESDFYKGK
jgi:hypothetical protein